MIALEWLRAVSKHLAVDAHENRTALHISTAVVHAVTNPISPFESLLRDVSAFSESVPEQLSFSAQVNLFQFWFRKWK